VLEVGLGGRLDAVNIIDTDCAIITSIDVDHTELLGHTREQIGLEKAGILRTGRPVVVSDPVPPQSVLDRATEIDADLWLLGRDYNYSGDQQQWAWAGRGRRYAGLAYPALRGANQLINASGVLAALEAMRPRLPVTAQAVRNGLALVELPGRFQVVPGQPAVVFDVAHNPQAAGVLNENLASMGFFPETWAVLGMLGDKDVAGVVRLLRDRVDHWLLASLPGPRGLSAARLAEILREVGVNGDISEHPSPASAYQVAAGRAAESDRIVVFGSFLTVADAMAVRKSPQ